jgi:hypothetical protein
MIASPSRTWRIRIAASSSKKETMIRRKDLRGAHEWIGAEELMRSLIVWRLSARKTSRSWRLVMSRVFEGGVGRASGGMVDRSSDSGVRDLEEEGLEETGELSEDIVYVLGSIEYEM